jgi:hypothetical protein
MTGRLKVWPDYGAPSPLWDGGEAVNLQSLPLPEDFRNRLSSLNAAYEESKVPIDATGDQQYLTEGQRLLNEVRLDGQYEVVTHEDWWGEPGLPFDQPGRRS